VDPRLVAAGAFIGFLVGLTGMGGGSLTTPFLILVLRTQPVMAVGTDLVYAAATKLAGTLTHLRQRTVDLRVSAFLAAGSIPGALSGVLLVSRLGSGANVLVKKALGGALVLVALSVLVRQLVRPQERPPSRHRAELTVGLGAGVGFLVGVTSVGSGTVMMAVLLLVYRVLPPERLVGTDVFQGFLISAAAGLAHWGAGHVDTHLLGAMLVGSIPGVVAGSRLSARVPARVLRPVLALTLLVSGLRMV
jgi:uncharacterized membrane protein YfcA